MWVALQKATHIFSAKKLQHICVSLIVNFNESLTNDVVSFEQLGPWYLSQVWLLISLGYISAFIQILECCPLKLVADFDAK